ncbi:MAG TPA: peroxidase-related enzyme [Stellaceae bacterium]|nr:peroxidase-related enzyme [Stellaceae bacterium]
MPDTILEPPPHTVPAVFTRALLDWLPWLEPLAVEALTERHRAGLVDAARVKSPYFRLLARDPDALRARTLTDKDIFYNTDAGLPRAERELAAAATSRFNGCIYCASVHARFSATYSKREDDVQRLLDDGIGAVSASAGMPSSLPRRRSARRRSRSDRSMWSGCVAPGWTIWRSPT